MSLRCFTRVPNCQEAIAKLKAEKQALATRAASALHNAEQQVQVLTNALITARRNGAVIPELSLHRGSHRGASERPAALGASSGPTRVPLWPGDTRGAPRS